MPPHLLFLPKTTNYPPVSVTDTQNIPLKKILGQRMKEADSFRVAHTTEAQRGPTAGQCHNVWASPRQGSTVQLAAGLWVTSTVASRVSELLWKRQPRASRVGVGVWTIAGVPDCPCKPFCKCQYYAGELKGKPQLSLLDNRD